jgi:hypothetical protein
LCSEFRYNFHQSQLPYRYTIAIRGTGPNKQPIGRRRFSETPFSMQAGEEADEESIAELQKI